MLGEPSLSWMIPVTPTTTFTLTGLNVLTLTFVMSGHTEIASIACSRSEVLLLSIRQGFLCDLVGTESAGKTKPCCRRGNGKMLLGALQEAWVTRCVRATQRKRGKSSRWLSDASFMNGSPNNEKSLLSSSNIQHGKQERRIPKKGFPPCVGHCAGRELESKLESKSTEWHQHYICPLTRLSILIFAKPSVVTLLSCHHLLLVD